MRLLQQVQRHKVTRLQDILIASRRPICLTKYVLASAEQDISGGGGEKKKRPDLKKSLGPLGPKRLVTVACILVVIYMYPMIFRPLFGIGSSDSPEKTLKELKKSGLDPAKTRPSYMPAWTSPFGPRSSGRDE